MDQHLIKTSLGKIEPTINLESLVISPNASKYAYVFGRKNKLWEKVWCIALNGHVISKEYNQIDPLSLVFSSDSKRFAYAGNRNGKKYFIIDNEESEGFDGGRTDALVFSPDSKQIAYGAVKDGEAFYIINGIPFDQKFYIVAGFLFSPDSKRYAFIGTTNMQKHIIILDGQWSNPYDMIIKPGIVFSPDSKRYAYRTQKGDKYYAIIDGKTYGPYDDIETTDLEFSADSEHFTYSVIDKNKTKIICDGEIVAEIDTIGNRGACFSNKSKYISFVYQKNGDDNWYWQLIDVVSNQVIEDKIPYKGIGITSPIFSSDDEKIVYELQNSNGKWFVMINGVKGPEVNGVSTPVFSKDTMHLMYRISKEDGDYIILDDMMSEKYEGVAGTSNIFSNDSKHIAYDFVQNGQQMIFLDGEKYGPFIGFLKKSHLFFDKICLRALVVDEYEVKKVEIPIENNKDFLNNIETYFSPIKTKTIVTLSTNVERAIEKAKSQIPEGWEFDRFDIISQGELKIITATSNSLESAWLEAERKVPKNTVIEEKKVNQEPYEKIIEVSAFSKKELDKIIAKNLSEGEIVKNIVEKKSGSRGFLGKAKKEFIYSVQIIKQVSSVRLNVNKF